MNVFSIFKSGLYERLPTKRPDRIPEPDLVMENENAVKEYDDLGKDGPLTGVYVYHLQHALTLIRPGDLILDLGCGPGNYLVQAAQLFPDAKFIGLDLSKPMLKIAEENIKQAGVENVSLLCGDMSNFESLLDAQPNMIMASFCMHHLPDLRSLQRCFSQIGKTLDPEGAIYILDLCRVRSDKTVSALIADVQFRASAREQQDYLDSLKAAFDPGELRSVLPFLGDRKINLYKSLIVPALAVIKTPKRVLPDAARMKSYCEMVDALSKSQKGDYNQMKAMFFWMSLAT